MDQQRLMAGAVGGLAGGVVFGVMMQTMGMLGMVAGLVGSDSAGVGWLVHLAISVLFGVGYAVVLGARSASWGHAAGIGAVYGVAWWVLGALLIMPLWMGMPVLQIGTPQIQSLIGHIVYGIVAAGVFHAMTQPARAGRVSSTS